MVGGGDPSDPKAFGMQSALYLAGDLQTGAGRGFAPSPPPPECLHQKNTLCFLLSSHNPLAVPETLPYLVLTLCQACAAAPGIPQKEKQTSPLPSRSIKFSESDGQNPTTQELIIQQPEMSQEKRGDLEQRIIYVRVSEK